MNVEEDKKSSIIEEIEEMAETDRDELIKKLKRFDKQKNTDNHLFLLHEVKNNIQLIDGFFSLLKQSSKDENKFSNYLNVLTHYIQDTRLLLTQTFNSEESNISLEEIHTQDILHELKESFIYIYPHVKFNFHSEKFLFFADKIKLTRILHNLIKNACESSDKDELSVSLMIYQESHYVRFIVGDNGDGIPSDIQEQLFSKSITTKESGYGIGLKLSYFLSKLHEGQLQCVSSNSYGTTFELLIPSNEK